MRICFFGDSFVNGTNDPAGLGWVGRVSGTAVRCGVDLTCYNLGIRRDTSLDVAARWRAEAERRLPPGTDGRLVFSFGVNDCTLDEAGFARVPSDRTMETANRLLTDASAWRPTLMVGPPPIADEGVNGRIRDLTRKLAGLCAGLGVPFLDVVTPLEGSPAWMEDVAAGDGAHPGADGYEALAGLIACWPAWAAWIASPGLR